MDSIAIIGFNASDGSEDALALGGVLRRMLGWRLVVAAAVVDPLYRPNGQYAQYLRREADDALASARTALEDHRDVEFRAVPGRSAGAALHAIAEELDAKLIIVGATHHRASADVFFPSVTHQTIQAAPCAVVVAPAGYRDVPHPTIHRIGVAFDGSPESRAALREATAVAVLTGAAIEVVHAYHPGVDATAFAAVSYAVPDFLEQAKSLARDQIDTAVEEVRRQAPDVSVDGRLMAGSAAEDLIEVSKNVDLLFIGSRGYGSLHRAMLGSVSGAVVRRAECPVFVLARGAQPQEPLDERSAGVAVPAA